MHFHFPKSLSGWREFGREVTIVVIGVLIALGLEQLVDHQNWQRKIDRAAGVMRIELAGDDGPQAYARLAIAPCLDTAIGQLHDAAGVVPTARLRQLVSAYAPPFRTWESEGWQAALASDVGGHVRSDKLFQWSEPYLLIGSMNQMNARENDLVIDLRETLPPKGDPSAAELQELRRETAELRALNVDLAGAARLLHDAMRDNAIAVPRATEARLLREATARYGRCVRDPALAPSVELPDFSTADDLRPFALGSR